MLNQTIDTLEQLSRYRINNIVSDLINLLDEVSTVSTPKSLPKLILQRRPSTRDGARIGAPSELVRDALLILKILARCMKCHWTFCKENHPLIDVAVPGLDHTVAQNTLRISIFYAHQSLDHDTPDDIGQQQPPVVKPSTYIIRYISASNWAICHGIWKQHLQSCSSAEQRAETRPLRMIDNMNMNLESLTSIIKG